MSAVYPTGWPLELRFRENAAEAAAGSYNAHYRGVAEQLASYGHDDAIIRVVWEFNGDWYPWGYLVRGQDQDHYAKNSRAAFRKLVNSFRRVSPNFQFVWSPALEDGNHMPTYRHTYGRTDCTR
jgi:hypothetical protein